MKNGRYNEITIRNIPLRKQSNFYQNCEIEVLQWPPQSPLI